MDNKLLFQKKHELWLTLKYSSLPIKDGAISNALRNFSEVAFRHMKWLGESIVADIQNYDYENHEIGRPELPTMFNFEKDDITIPLHDGKQLLEGCRKRLEEIVGCYDTSIPLHKRMAGDDEYFLYRLNRITSLHEGIEVGDTFFGGEKPIRELLGIDEDEIKHFMDTLRQQQTKEYRHVVMYLYILVHTAKTELADIFYEQLLESFYHQFHYARLLASLGVIEVPPTVNKSSYQVGSMLEFVRSAVNDEDQEVQDLKSMAATVPNEDFRRLVEFVLNQEEHHLTLLDQALKILEKND